MTVGAALTIGRWLFLGVLTLMVLALFRTMRSELRHAAKPGPDRRDAPQGTDLRVQVVQGGLAGQEFLLRDALTIGKASDNDLVLPDLGVSSHHARLVVSRRRVWIEDLNSTNGTTLGDKPVRGRAVLVPGAEVGIGLARLRLLD